MAAFTWGGYKFREAGADYLSPIAGFGWDRSQVRAQYLVAGPQSQGVGNSWVGACQALLGNVNVITGSVNGSPVPFLQRINDATPSAHPWPYGNGFFAMAIAEAKGEGTPLGKDENGVMSYSDMRVTVIYEEPMWDLANDASVTNPLYGGLPDESLLLRNIWRTEEDRESMLTYRTGMWQWIDADRFGQQADIPAGRPWPITRITWKWMQVPYSALPRNAQRNAVGTLNETEFDNCPAGTLLIRSPRYEVYRNFYGVKMCNCSIIADFNPLGWNNFPDPARPGGTGLITSNPATAAGFFHVGRVSGGRIVPHAHPYQWLNWRLINLLGAAVPAGFPLGIATLFRPSVFGT